ncbi:membrane protein of ER body 2 isoform X3 [Arabidopsis lyrata subsp. lyrata]|uniref:membrane protein of ER body 2 isoform X3 n=1 Tax=Arabidopsis lyrata subsp. lyrata TaxID=81972 RepID=UPI000A29BCEC|nr:membrane protein of ER body 2 isoform X3 [Arabidopsis lyrata subsp. lyrata]|eukprot:XP_020878970.1 membrane protein of ER body 2 isoform X3 [Arabidopsis lyrata subsp. lyrata]
MEKSNGPVNASWSELKDGDKELVDAECLVDLLESYRFGKDNVPAREFRFKAAATAPAPVNTTEIEVEVEEDNDGSQAQQGNTSVRESTSSLFSSSDPIILETTVSETGSNNETGSNQGTGSNEENGNNWLESSSTNLPKVENERQQNGEDCEMEEEEKNERSSSVSEEKLLATQENYELGEEDEEKKERSSSDSEEKSNLEKLLATQEKYELYCPSCSSCITRKVILKKRKRGKHVDSSPDLKPDVPVVEPSHIEEMEPPVKVHVPETRIEDDNQEDKEEGIIFNCLACLKYFIRLVSGTRFLQLDYITGKPVEEPVEECIEVIMRNSINTTQSPTQIQPDRERFAVELLKSTVYGGLTETITSLGVVSSASASGSSTMNILALAVANLAGGLIVLAQNLQDLRNSSDQEKDRYEELLGRRANFRIHILVAVMSYIFFGIMPPLVYAFSFYETGIKNYKLISVFLVSLLCVILLGMIKVYVRKPPNSRELTKAYLKSAAYYTSTVVASCGISYFVGDIMGEYTGKLSLVGLDQISITSPCYGTKPEECRFTSF